MASWLVLDWDQDQFHILCAQSGRGGIKITRAVTWDHPEPFTPSTAERVGKALRDFLAAKSIAAAPVIFGVGRDRVFLKELRFPPIAPHEEANLVRFQTGKEMAEAIDNYSVDYAHLANGDNERHVITVAARRDIVAMIQVLCQSAGLKLHAITPRLFGVAHVLARSRSPESVALKSKQLSVVLSIGHRWTGLIFLRGDRLLQAQALANGPLLAGEVKRNLAVFLAQNAANLELETPECLYVFGDNETALQGLQKGVQLPLRLLDPLKNDTAAAAEAKNPALFAGAIGLACLWSDSSEKPVNLAAPKRQTAPVSITRQRATVYGAAAAALLVFMVGGMVYSLSIKKSKIAELTMRKFELERDMTDNAQARAEVDAYVDWDQSKVPWLDEMYDLTARFPFKKDFRVNQFAGTSTGSKKGSKDGTIGRIALSGITPKGEDKNTVYALHSAMSSDPHLRPAIDGIKNQTNYSIKIDLFKQDFPKYTTHLVVPPKQRLEAPPPDEKKQVAEIMPDEKKDTEPDTDPDPEGGSR